jgi:hypothetical protein
MELYSWVANALPRPPAKRAAPYGIIKAIGNSASIWTPFTYYDAQKPYYRLALSICIALQLLGGIASLFLCSTLRMLNKRQMQVENEDVPLDEKDLRKLQVTADNEGVDIAAAHRLQKGFRYML